MRWDYRNRIYAQLWSHVVYSHRNEFFLSHLVSISSNKPNTNTQESHKSTQSSCILYTEEESHKSSKLLTCLITFLGHWGIKRGDLIMERERRRKRSQGVAAIGARSLPSVKLPKFAQHSTAQLFQFYLSTVKWTYYSSCTGTWSSCLHLPCAGIAGQHPQTHQQ